MTSMLPILDEKPSINNVEQLLIHIKNVPESLKNLANYEQNLYDHKKDLRILFIACKDKQYKDIIAYSFLSEEEGLIDDDLFVIKDIIDESVISNIPNNYFDIILWAGCDISLSLKRSLLIYDKLKINGRIYIDNLLAEFVSTVTDVCKIADIEIHKVFGTNNNNNLIKLLHAIFNDRFNVQLKNYSGTSFIVLIKDEKSCPKIPYLKQDLVPPILLPGLANVKGFSCFMDSVLFSILFPQNNYFNKALLNKEITVATCENKPGISFIKEFQKRLKKLSIDMRTHLGSQLTCQPIINVMKQCGDISKHLVSGEQQDDSEFLMVLMSIFDLHPTKIMITTEFSNDKNNWTSTQKEEDILILELPIDKGMENYNLTEWYQRISIMDYEKIPATTWSWNDGKNDIAYDNASSKIIADAYMNYMNKLTLDPRITLKIENTTITFDFQKSIQTFVELGSSHSIKRNVNWPIYGGNFYRYMRTAQTILSADALIFHVGRRIYDQKTKSFYKSKQSVKIEQYIKNDDQLFELQVITIHVGSAYGGHYTTYFKYGPQWYYYNDIATIRVKIAKLSEVIEKGQTSGSLYMYFPI